jgi:hypothetical protein
VNALLELRAWDGALISRGGWGQYCIGLPSLLSTSKYNVTYNWDLLPPPVSALIKLLHQKAIKHLFLQQWKNLPMPRV